MLRLSPSDSSADVAAAPAMLSGLKAARQGASDIHSLPAATTTKTLH